VLEGTFEDGTGAPAHAHRHEEAFSGLNGSFDFRLGDNAWTLGQGRFVFVPRVVEQGTHNSGSTSGQALGIISPGGFERLFEKISSLT